MPADKIQKFRKISQESPDNELARYSLASALLEDNLFEEAAEHFGAALEIKSDWVMAYILCARCLIHLRKYDEAKALLHKGREYSIAQGHEGPVEEIDDILEDLPSS